MLCCSLLQQKAHLTSDLLLLILLAGAGAMSRHPIATMSAKDIAAVCIRIGADLQLLRSMIGAQTSLDLHGTLFD